MFETWPKRLQSEFIWLKVFAHLFISRIFIGMYGFGGILQRSSKCYQWGFSKPRQRSAKVFIFFLFAFLIIYLLLFLFIHCIMHFLDRLQKLWKNESRPIRCTLQKLINVHSPLILIILMAYFSTLFHIHVASFENFTYHNSSDQHFYHPFVLSPL